MGLDTSHGAWHGAYSAFARWRQMLAKVAGYSIWKVCFGDGVLRETVMIDWGHITEENLMGKWTKTPEDPLIVLIAHSDCEGEIYPEQARALADRLEELLPKLPEADDPGHIGNWRDKTQHFIIGLRAAAAANEPLEFH